MERFKFIRRGIVFGVLAGLLLLNPAFGVSYNGIIKIHDDVFTTLGTDKSNYADVVFIFSGGSPNQNSDSNPGSLTLLTENVDYTVHQLVTSYTTITISNYSSRNVYMLLKGETYYVVKGAITLGNPMPTTTTYNSLASYYLLGSPGAPTGISVEALYETANASWTLNDGVANYDIDGVDLQVATDSDFTGIVSEDDGETTELGALEEYTTGQLIDGRVLSPSTTYYLRTRCSVEGVAASSWTSGYEFETLGAPAQTYVLTLESLVNDGTGFGINAFSMPFASPWYVDGDQVENAYELVVAINAAAGSSVVSSFGYWDSSNQAAAGVMIDDITDTAIISALQAIELAQGVGYQLYVTEDVADILISNTE